MTQTLSIYLNIDIIFWFVKTRAVYILYKEMVGL